MHTLSIKSAIAGWIAAIFGTIIVLGFHVGGYKLDGPFLENASGLAMLAAYTALLSGIVVFIVWLFILLPLSFLLAPGSWIFRFPQSLVCGAAAGTALYLAFAVLSDSEIMPFMLIGTFTGLTTALCSSVLVLQQNNIRQPGGAHQ